MPPTPGNNSGCSKPLFRPITGIMARPFANPTNILITGASSGIGAALARGYAKPGRYLALSGRDAARLHDVAAECRELGAEVEAEPIDVRDRDAMAAWIARIDADHRLDLAIANAGISGGAADGGESDEQARDIFAVNLAGVLNTISPAVSAMKLRRRGQIGIVSSIAGFRGLPSAPAYSASKAAVKVYGEALRGALHGDGIGVSVICPGFVASRMTDKNDYTMPLIMSAERAALIISGGLARNSARIAFPWPMYLAIWLMTALPPLMTDIAFRWLPKKK